MTKPSKPNQELFKILCARQAPFGADQWLHQYGQKGLIAAIDELGQPQSHQTLQEIERFGSLWLMNELIKMQNSGAPINASLPVLSRLAASSFSALLSNQNSPSRAIETKTIFDFCISNPDGPIFFPHSLFSNVLRLSRYFLTLEDLLPCSKGQNHDQGFLAKTLKHQLNLLSQSQLPDEEKLVVINSTLKTLLSLPKNQDDPPQTVSEKLSSWWVNERRLVQSGHSVFSKSEAKLIEKSVMQQALSNDFLWNLSIFSSPQKNHSHLFLKKLLQDSLLTPNELEKMGANIHWFIFKDPHYEMAEISPFVIDACTSLMKALGPDYFPHRPFQQGPSADDLLAHLSQQLAAALKNTSENSHVSLSHLFKSILGCVDVWCEQSGPDQVKMFKEKLGNRIALAVCFAFIHGVHVSQNTFQTLPLTVEKRLHEWVGLAEKIPSPSMEVSLTHPKEHVFLIRLKSDLQVLSDPSKHQPSEKLIKLMKRLPDPVSCAIAIIARQIIPNIVPAPRPDQPCLTIAINSAVINEFKSSAGNEKLNQVLSILEKQNLSAHTHQIQKGKGATRVIRKI